MIWQFFSNNISLSNNEPIAKAGLFERGLLFLVFMTYLLYPFQDVSILWEHAKIYYFMGLAIFVLIFFRLLFEKDRGVSLSFIPFFFSFALFVLWSIFSILWSLDPSSSLFSCVKYTFYLCFALFLAQIFSKSPQFLEISATKGMAFSVVIVTILYVVVFFRDNGLSVLAQPFTPDYFKVIGAYNFGFGGGRNLLASWLCFNITFTIPILFLRTCKSIMGKIMFLFSLPVLSLTFSRTALLGLFAFFILSLFFLNKNERRLLRRSYPVHLLLIAITGIIILNPFDLRGKMIHRITAPMEHFQGKTDDGGVAGRKILWNIAWDSFQNNPFIGTGIGAIDRHKENVPEDNYHNIYLQFMAQLGLIGFSLFLIWTFLLLFATRSICHPSPVQSPIDILLGKILFINFIVYYFKSFFMFQYFDFEIWTLVTFILVEYGHKIRKCKLLGSRDLDTAL
jgi:O-antigen ligase